MSRFFYRVILVFGFMLIFLFNLSFGVYTKKVEIRFSPEVFSELSYSNLSIYSDGGISLGYSLRELFNGSELFASSIEKISNYLVFSTVNPNNLYLYYENRIENIGALLNHSILIKVKVINDLIYALTGESGAVYLLNFASNDPFVRLEDNYVWDIFQLNKKIYVITGNKACIYEISKDRYKKIFESSNDKHLITSLVDGNNVYVGSSGTGTIYVFDGKVVKPFISLKGGEITDIKKFMNYLIVSTYSFSPQTQQTTQQDSKSTQPIPINILRSTQGSVYKIDISSKQVELLFSEFGITSLEVIDDKVLATTIDGKILEYSIHERRLRYSMYGLNFVKLVNLGNNFYVLGANPSSVNFIDSLDTGLSGYLETKEIDVGRVSRWGRIVYDAIIPNDTFVNVFIKGGNTPKEDGSWSDWVEVKEFINLDKYQYVKLKVVLSSKNRKAFPIVKSISLFYTPQNSKPVISSFNASLQGDSLNFEWKASDPDEDKLQFYLFARDYNLSQWQMISKEPIYDTKFSINKYFLGNGVFSFMLVASDYLSNPPGLHLSETNFIEKFVIDTIPPYLDEKSIKVFTNIDTIQVEFRIFDNSILKEVQFSTDGINWFYCLPLDGVIDSGSELFRLDITKSTKVILLKIVDEVGNINTSRISF